MEENVFMPMSNEAVGMSCKPKVDGAAEAPMDPVCEGVVLENDTSQASWE